MATINTFIFLDLELSGQDKGKDSPNRITEMGLVAVSRKKIIEKHTRSKQETRHSTSFLPRVINKINCAINPCQMINPMSSIISDLTNEDLEDQKPFDETIYLLIIHFMKRFEKPICLVAHDGCRVDFPILQSELTKNGRVLPNDVFCADSLIGFRDVLTKQPVGFRDVQTKQPTREKIIDGVSIPENCTVQDYEMAKVIANAEYLMMDHISGFDSFESKQGKIQRHLREISTSRQQNQSRNQGTEEYGAIRRLPAVNCCTPTSGEPKSLQKFNLKDLYQDLTGKPLKVEHQAEADAEALLECVVAVGLPILEWMDKNRTPFKSIKNKW